MLRKFKPNKAMNITLLSPRTDHRYTFASDIEVGAVFNEVWNKVDEDWMIFLCTKKGGEKLVEINAPKDISIEEFPVLTEHDILGTDPDLESHPVIVSQEKKKSDANTATSEVDERNAAREVAEKFEKEVILEEEKIEEPEEVIVEAEKIEESEEVIVEAEKAYSENVENFLNFVDKNPSFSDTELVNELKVEFNKPSLVEMCEEIEVDSEGKKAELITRLLDSLLE